MGSCHSLIPKSSTRIAPGGHNETLIGQSMEHSDHQAGGRSKDLRVANCHIVGHNMVKFHLRPPARQGCFDLGERLCVCVLIAQQQ